MKRLSFVSVSLLSVLPFLSGQGCPRTTPTLTLSAADNAAIDSAVEACAALSQGAATSQAPASDDTSGSQAEGTHIVGTCPVVKTELAVDAEEGVAAILDIDFGNTPCSPAAMPGLLCSGSASGSFNGSSHTIVLNFSALTCGGDVLNGTAETVFSFADLGVVLIGSFDLDWTSGTDHVGVEGQGEYSYDRNAKASTIATFVGSVSDSESTYNTTLTDIVISYQNNGNLIPSTGVISLSGDTIHNLIVRFNADSPATGEVEVSIDGGRFFTVNVFGL